MLTLEFHDPSGKLEVTQRHAPRLPSLEGKRIGFISNEQWQAHRMLPMLAATLKADFPGVEVLPIDALPQGNATICTEQTADLVRKSGVDAVIIGNAACGACATACGRAAARIEGQGIPTVTLTRTDFVGVMKNALTGLGLAPDAAMVTFSMDMFLPGSDLAPVRDRRREVYDGLMRWECALAQDSKGAASMLSVKGATYEDAFNKANNLLLTNMQGDGLPLCLPTRDRTDWVLRGSALSRAHTIGRFPPRGGVTTVETCAVALAMAGGRPEYLPVLIAAVEAFLDGDLESDQLQATSGGTFPVVIVNGPLAKQIRLNSGYGCLGPDPQRPAGASIGRALRLLQQNVGGALPGSGTMATFGAMRYTNAVFGEAEEALPEGWQPHATERHGFAPGTNSVSLVFANGVTNINRTGAKEETPEKEVMFGMWRMADFMRTPNVSALEGYEQGTPGIVMISPPVAKIMAELGWTRASIRDFLWEKSRIPMEHLRRAGFSGRIDNGPNPATRASSKLDPWPVTLKPENIVIVVAGGDHPTHFHWLQAYSPRVIGRGMRVPESFDHLLADADRDLGCGADVCRI